MSDIGMRLTAGGKMILAKGLAGKEIRFSKVAFGAGDFDYNTEKVSELTEMRDWKMDLPITDKKIEGGMVKIIATLNNFELETGFAAKEIGIYALDPDTGEELLYAYRNAGDEYNFIPGGNGIVKKNATFAYWVEIDDAPNVTFNIDYSFAHVTLEDYEEHLNSKNPHPNTPTHFDDVDFTDNFWVTDFDSDLHKISVARMKDILLREVEKNLADKTRKLEELQDFIAAKNYLGMFETNLLLIENFTDKKLIDDTKIQVTSCTKDGNLLSVQTLDNISIGKEFYLTDGLSCEKVIIVAVAISNSKILINNSSYVLTVESDLMNDYDLTKTYLCRTTFSGGKATKPIQSVKWKSRETFTGHPASITREVCLDFSSDNHAAFDISGDGFLVDGFFSL